MQRKIAVNFRCFACLYAQCRNQGMKILIDRRTFLYPSSFRSSLFMNPACNHSRKVNKNSFFTRIRNLILSPHREVERGTKVENKRTISKKLPRYKTPIATSTAADVSQKLFNIKVPLTRQRNEGCQVNSVRAAQNSQKAKVTWLTELSTSHC